MGNQVNKDLKRSLTNTRTGTYMHKYSNIGGLSPIMKIFGCMRCSWIGSEMCPHRKLNGEHHANWICSERILYLKEEMQKVGSVPRLIQNEEAVKLKMLSDRMYWEYGETGELHEDFKHVQKILTSLVDKMRKQDEGIKIQEEVSVTVEDFRKIVDTQAEIVKDKDIVKEAELIDNRSDKPKRERETSEKV